jgi:hypothetical protein
MDKFIIMNVHDVTTKNPKNNPFFFFFLGVLKKIHGKNNGIKFQN